MPRIVYNSSDDNLFSGTIYDKNDLPLAIPSGSSLLAFVQDIGSTVKIIDDTIIGEFDTGNDWPNGVISGVYDKTDSAALALHDDTDVLECIRMTINGKTETLTRVIKARKLL